jgi:ubiquinol-cytochrome c reductase cytochrome c subunit
MRKMNRTATVAATIAVASLALSLFSASAATAQPAPAAPAPAAAAPAAPPSGDAVAGKANFMKYGCYECHGTVGLGNYFSGIKIAPHPLPFAVITKYVRNPTGDMPSYSAKILPEKDLADIYAYLSSIPAGKAPADIPLLNAVGTKAK